MHQNGPAGELTVLPGPLAGLMGRNKKEKRGKIKRHWTEGGGRMMIASESLTATTESGLLSPPTVFIFETCSSSFDRRSISPPNLRTVPSSTSMKCVWFGSSAVVLFSRGSFGL